MVDIMKKEIDGVKFDHDCSIITYWYDDYTDEIKNKIFKKHFNILRIIDYDYIEGVPVHKLSLYRILDYDAGLIKKGSINHNFE